MADTFKVLGQSAPTIYTLTDLYTVPAATSTAVSSIAICNRDTAATSFRLSIAAAGAADAVSQYIYYDVAIRANDTFIATVGFTLATTDKIRVYGSGSALTFSLFGVEIT